MIKMKKNGITKSNQNDEKEIRMIKYQTLENVGIGD